MGFKKMRGVKLPYDMQGYLYFYFRRFNKLSNEDKNYIVELVKKYCGEYWYAVFEFLTTDKPIHQIAMDNYIDETTLYRLRKKVFENY